MFCVLDGISAVEREGILEGIFPTRVGFVDRGPCAEEGEESGGVAYGVVVFEADADSLVRKQGHLNLNDPTILITPSVLI